MQLVRLDQVLGLAATAVEHLVEPAGRAGEVGDDERPGGLSSDLRRRRGQQLSLFHAHHDSRCFLPIHIYEAVIGKPVAIILRPGKTPDGAEVALVLRHLVKAIRRRWPKVEIVIRGDSHYARPEAMSWLERNRVRYVFGLAGNRVLHEGTAALAEDAAVRRAEEDAEKVRRFHDFRYAARSWREKERRVISRIEATRQGSDSRFVVTNLTGYPTLALRGPLLRPRPG